MMEIKADTKKARKQIEKMLDAKVTEFKVHNFCCTPDNARLTTVRTQHTGHERIRYQWRCKTCGRFVSRQFSLPFQDLNESINNLKKAMREAAPSFMDCAKALETLSKGRLTLKEAVRNLKINLKRMVTK
jgi:transposase-like protein